MRRRAVLRGLIAAAGLTFVPKPQPSAAARLDLSPAAKAAGAGAPVSGRTVARQVDHPVPGVLAGMVRLPSGEIVPTADAIGSTGIGTVSITSDVIDAGQLFERVGVHFTTARGAEGSIFVEIRASSDGASWTEWRPLHVDEDLTDPSTNTYYIAPAPVPPTSRLAQYRVWLTGGDPADLRHIALTFLDVNDLNASPVARILTRIRHSLSNGFEESGVAMAATGASKILTRQDWAADESRMRWTPRYAQWQKAIVHHTVTADGGTNVAAEIRSIYHFHAVTRGWGDLGYHYLVDKYGNIWTGRQGGDHVVAGHAFGWNDGTMGVAAIGDYTSVAPTGQMQGAIANILAQKFKQLGIPPFGNGAFTHQEQRTDGSWTKVTTVVPNVIGHRDANYVVGKTGAQTACPGTRIYGMFDGLRSLAQNAWNAGYTYFAVLEPDLAPAGVAGQPMTVPVTIKNLGNVTIPAGTLVNWRALRNGTQVTQGAGVALAQPVAPGGAATVSVPFTPPPLGNYIVRWDLQTGSAWWSAVYNSPFRDMWFRSADWSADWISDDVSRNWTAGETRMVTVTVRNDGGRPWNATGTNPVRLGYYWVSNFTGQRFDGQAKLPLPYDVAPGATITLTMPVTAPLYPTNYTMWLDLYKENEFWFRDKGLAPDDTPVTVGVDFKARYITQTPLPPLSAKVTTKIPVTIVNLGRGMFPVTSGNPVNLGYHWYDAAGRTVHWDGARTKLPADLAPGQSVTVEADVTAPDTGGQYQLKFDLVQEGVGWFSDKGVQMPSLVAAVAGPVIPVYAAVYAPGVSALARSGGLAAIPFTITNRSNFTWQAAGANPVTLSYHWYDAQGRVVVWDGMRTKLTADVAPGESQTVQAQVAFPTVQGTYRLRWDLVHEGITWFSGKGVTPFEQTVIVGPPPFYGGSMDVSRVPGTMAAAARLTVPLRVQNMSNFGWDSTVNLSYHWYDAAGRAVVWDGVRTPLAGIAVDQVRAVDANVEVPSVPGTYTLKFDIVQEGVAWFSGKGMLLAPIAVKVESAPYGAVYAAPDAVSAPKGAVVTIPVAIRNSGGLAWQPAQVYLAYHLIAASGNVYVWDGARTAITAPIATNGVATVQAQVRVPQVAGVFEIRWDLVHEGVAWFSDKGVATSSTTLTVQ